MNRSRRFRLGLLAVFVATLATLLVVSPGSRMDSASGPGSGAGAPSTAAPLLDDGLTGTGRDTITLSHSASSASAEAVRESQDESLRSLVVQVVDRGLRHGIQDVPVALTIWRRFPADEDYAPVQTDANGMASFQVPTGRFAYRLVGDAKAAYPGFQSMAEARHLAESFRVEYNTCRPHSSLGYLTPAEFAAGCAPGGSATLRLRAHTPGHTNRAFTNPFHSHSNWTKERGHVTAPPLSASAGQPEEVLGELCVSSPVTFDRGPRLRPVRVLQAQGSCARAFFRTGRSRIAVGWDVWMPDEV